MDEAWQANRDAPDQKTFALAVKDLPGSSLLFMARKIDAEHVKDVWNAMDLQAQRKLCERKYETANLPKD